MSKTDLYHKDHTLRSVSIGTVLRLLRYPFLLLSVTLIPRFMGDAVYGQYAYYMSILLIMDIAGDMGYMQIFGRFMPEHDVAGEERTMKAIVQHTLIFGLTVSSAVIGILCISRMGSGVPVMPLFWILLLALQLLLTQSEGILFASLYGLNKMVFFSAKEVLRSAATFFFVLSLFGVGGLTGALWGLVLAEAVLLVLALVWTKSYIFTRWEPIRWSFFKPYIVFGLQFYLPQFLYGLLQRSGNVFIKSLTHKPEEVAYFDIANQFLLIVGSTMGLLISTLLPSLAASFVKNDMEHVFRWKRNVMTYCTILVLLTINAVFWLGESVISFALGEEFASVIPNALLLSVALVPYLIAQVGINFSVLHKQPRVYTMAIGAGLLMMVACSLLLIPTFGALGASGASLAGYSTFCAVFMLKYPREYRQVLSKLLRLVPPTLVLILLFFFDWPAVWRPVLFLLTSVLFLLFIFWRKIISVEEIKQFMSTMRKKK